MVAASHRVLSRDGIYLSKFSPEASWDAVLAGRNVLAGTIHQVFEKKERENRDYKVSEII